uniref:DNA-processing protein DprA n=1 Tax=uncultured Legionella sp. TaxID=210934 RepID=UPI0026018B7C
LSALEQPLLAVVGSRNPSITGCENAKNFAKELSTHGVTIVSGLALGIDGQAHMGCVEAGGKTIAVLGTGINCIYPRRHSKLAAQIPQNGLLISEFPLNSPPIAGHFPRRNRIISGLSLCTLVIESAIKSGSLITAKMALEQNRDVLAIPGSIHNPLARGCHHLLQQGAKLVTSVTDILEELRIDSSHLTVDKPIISLASGNENLVKFIGFELTSIDQIIVRSGYTIEQVTGELAELELQGTVRTVPGGYIRC